MCVCVWAKDLIDSIANTQTHMHTHTHTLVYIRLGEWSRTVTRLHMHACTTTKCSDKNSLRIALSTTPNYKTSRPFHNEIKCLKWKLVLCILPVNNQNTRLVWTWLHSWVASSGSRVFCGAFKLVYLTATRNNDPRKNNMGRVFCKFKRFKALD